MKHQKTALGLFLLFGLHLSIGPAIAAECQAQIDRELQRLNISTDTIESMKVMKRSFGGNSASNFSYDAWTRLNTCNSGYFVVNLSPSCAVMQSYTQGDCNLDGIRNY